MFLIFLLICVVLRAFSAQAKVVETFQECKEFFYDDQEPVGMDQNGMKICQKLQEGGFYYATLYSVRHRIPLYSAYTLGADCNNPKENIWRIEPQISNIDIDYMVSESDHSINKNIIKVKQAMSSDYTTTGCDRGHLNPNSFQCREGRTATFTLTNAAPMDPRFNQVLWCSWERTLKKFLKHLNINGKAYIVTGTVPSANVRIPRRKPPEDSNRVTVPTYVWTAVCYKHRRDNAQSFSFGYIGENHPNANIKLMNVSALNDNLSKHYSELTSTHQSIRIFHGDCFIDNYNNFKETLNNVFGKLINPPLNPGVDDCLKRERDSEYDEFHRRCPSEQSDVESLLVPEEQETAADGCLDDTECCDEGDEPYKYGEKNVWCYTDNNNKNQNDCSTLDDCFSAAKERTCKPEHPCGHYGEKYLWCYTTDGSWYDSWDYCSTDCSQ